MESVNLNVHLEATFLPDNTKVSGKGNGPQLPTKWRKSETLIYIESLNNQRHTHAYIYVNIHMEKYRQRNNGKNIMVETPFECYRTLFQPFWEFMKLLFINVYSSKYAYIYTCIHAYCIVLYCTVLYCIVLYCIVLYRIVFEYLYSALQQPWANRGAFGSVSSKKRDRL